MRSKVHYSYVQFHDPEEAFWLPASAVIDLETPKQHWRNASSKYFSIPIPWSFFQTAWYWTSMAHCQSLPNDFVGIFAGGEPPTTFLKKIGIGFGQRDLTVEGVREARESREANRASDTLLAAR